MLNSSAYVPALPAAIDGGWSAYRDGGSCSTSCGVGELIQFRLCDSPAPQNGGQPCRGDSIRTIACERSDCGETQVSFSMQDQHDFMHQFITGSAPVESAIPSEPTSILPSEALLMAPSSNMVCSSESTQSGANIVDITACMQACQGSTFTFVETGDCNCFDSCEAVPQELVQLPQPAAMR